MKSFRQGRLEIYRLDAFADNYLWVVQDAVSKDWAAIDPGDPKPVVELCDRKNARLRYVFNTHHHADHVQGNAQLRQLFGCEIIAPEPISGYFPAATHYARDGERLRTSLESIRLVSTPGHTDEHCVFAFEDSRVLFCGDTLFALGCGRTIGEKNMKLMWNSMQKLQRMEDDWMVCCAHEYGVRNAQFAASLGIDDAKLWERIRQIRKNGNDNVPFALGLEKSANPFLRAGTPPFLQRFGKPDLAGAHTEKASPEKAFIALRTMRNHFHA